MLKQQFESEKLMIFLQLFKKNKKLNKYLFILLALPHFNNFEIYF